MTFYDQDGAAGAPEAPGGPGPAAPDEADIWTDPADPVDPPVVPPSAPPSARRPPRPGQRPVPTAGPDPRRAQARPDRDDEYFDLPHESRVPRWLAALLVIGLVVVAVAGGAMWWYRNQVDPAGEPGAAVTVVVPEGASTNRVGQILDQEGVITSATLFNFYVGGKDLTDVQAGSYQFQEDMSFDEAIAVLKAGPKEPAARAVSKVTIPEGYTVRQILERIHKKVPRLTVEDLQAALDSGDVTSSLKPADQTSWEGLLFPATYEIGAKDTATDVMSMMAAEMETRVNELGIEQAQAHIKQKWGLDVSAYDLLKVASMIQYEAAVPDDAPKIGAVTYNRLEQGMPLQHDSTSIYEANMAGKDITKIDYDADTPYNTRTHTGLPPTPIASPGEYALQGAMQPADGPWLYFVLTDPKVVSFTDSYDEFLDFKAECVAKDLGCG